MSYRTYSVTRKDLADYYTPKSDIYNLMIASINAGGYGQVIYDFVNTFDNSINSFNIWNPDTSRMEVFNPNNNTWYLQSEAGPSLWGVSSEFGLSFLAGNASIIGLAKLKYCNGCSNRSGLPTTAISSFSSRFTSLKDMMDLNGADTGYLFYDFALPLNQNYFKSVVEIGSGNYIFRDWQNTPKTESQVAAQTGIPTAEITDSISKSEPILPPKTFNYLLRWCCNPSFTTVIELPYELSSKTIAFKDGRGTFPPCWSVEPTTDVAMEKAESVKEYEFCIDCQREQGLCKR